MNKLIIASTAAALAMGGSVVALAKATEAECTTRFEQADTDKDGVLRPDEAEVYVVAMEKVQLKPKNVMMVTRGEFVVACRKDAFAAIEPAAAGAKTAAAGQPATGAQSSAGGKQESPAPAQGVLASALIGTPVYTSSNQSIGEVDDLILDREGRAADKVIVGVGGFLGIGEKDIVLDRSRLDFVATDGGVKIVVDTDKSELEKLPPYKAQQP